MEAAAVDGPLPWVADAEAARAPGSRAGSEAPSGGAAAGAPFVQEAAAEAAIRNLDSLPANTPIYSIPKCRS